MTETDEKRRLPADLAGTALVVVDMQNGFCHPDGSVARAMPVDANRAVIPRIEQLVRAAREAGLLVVWSRQEHLRGDVSIDRSHLDNPQARLADPPCLAGTWDAALIDELAPLAQEDDLHVVKHRASAFYGTNLEVGLRMRGIRRLIVTGVTTSYCVDATVRDAYARDLGVFLVEDACGSPWPDLHEATVRNTAIFHGVVLDTSTCVRELAG
ncbi:MAG: cysteine hydrolase [Nocardioidaceae bacterium]|nr:cysteine hydrolase [Nocardioidaceae bacterium]